MGDLSSLFKVLEFQLIKILAQKDKYIYSPSRGGTFSTLVDFPGSGTVWLLLGSEEGGGLVNVVVHSDDVESAVRLVGEVEVCGEARRDGHGLVVRLVARQHRPRTGDRHRALQSGGRGQRRLEVRQGHWLSHTHGQMVYVYLKRETLK